MRRRSITGIFAFITSRYVFASHGVPSFVSDAKEGGPVIVNLWHGMPIKVIGHADPDQGFGATQYCDYVLSTSPFFTCVMSRAFGLPPSAVLEFGLPRNDVLASGQNSVTAAVMRDTLGLAQCSRVVFWLPTYRQTHYRDGRCDSPDKSFLDDWDNDFLSRLDGMASQSNCYVIIKLHPLDCINKVELPHTTDRVKLITAEAWGNLGMELYDALAVSDGLISDVSSIIVDYLAARRPIGVTRRSVERYARGFIPGTRDLLDDCAAIETEADVHEFLSAVVAGAAHVPEKAEKFNSTGDGRASERIVQYFAL